MVTTSKHVSGAVGIRAGIIACVQVYELRCPYAPCAGRGYTWDITPYWSREEIARCAETGARVRCSECDRDFTIPEVAR